MVSINRVCHDAVWIEGRRLGDVGASSHWVGRGFSATISDLFYKCLLSIYYETGSGDGAVNKVPWKLYYSSRERKTINA